MPTDVEQNHDHIGDADTVYMTHPDTEGVGSSLGRAFKRVWAPKGWTQTTREAWEEHTAKANEELTAFVASGDAVLPPGEPEAQDIINGESAGRVAKARHAGGATSGEVV